MANEPWKMPILEYVVLEKFKIHAKQELPPDTVQAIMTNTEVIQQFDHIAMGRVLYWQNAFLKGEIITKYREEEFTHHMLVHATWWDHLKDTLNRKIPFCRFKTNYDSRIETFRHQFPVESTLICPHHGPLDKNQEHFKFLLPHHVFPTSNSGE